MAIYHREYQCKTSLYMARYNIITIIINTRVCIYIMQIPIYIYQRSIYCVSLFDLPCFVTCGIVHLSCTLYEYTHIYIYIYIHMYIYYSPPPLGRWTCIVTCGTCHINNPLRCITPLAPRSIYLVFSRKRYIFMHYPMRVSATSSPMTSKALYPVGCKNLP